MAASRTKKSIAAATVACLLALGVPSPAAARLTVSVHFVYGGVAAGGIAIFIAFSGAWEALTGADPPPDALPDALVEVARGHARLGLPLTSLHSALPGETADPPAAGGLGLNLLRLRF